MAIFCCNFAYSQGYYHGFGAQFNYGIFSQESTFSSSTSTPSVPGVFYKATYAFSEKFAVSAYPFIGFSGSASSRNGTTGSVGIQLPIVAELYFGEIDASNFFLGAGFSYASIGSTDFGSGKVFGPQISAGGQFELVGRLLGVRAGYSFGLNKTDGIIESTKDSHNVISVGVYYLLGVN